MKYDLINRLNKENEKSTIALDKEHEYKINNSAAAVIQIQALAKQNKDSNDNDVEMLYKIIGVGLGKEAIDYIKEQNYSIAALSTVTEAISAAIANQTLEEFEKDLKDREVTPRK